MSDVQKKDVLRQMLRLASRKNNDSVRLAFLSQEEAGEIQRLDLGALTELKRHGNGAVEIKLVDKRKVLEALYGMLRDNGDGDTNAFLKALDKPEGEA